MSPAQPTGPVPYVRWLDAAAAGALDQVREALDRGADIHEKNDCALRMAAMHGHDATVALLLDRGACIHSMNDAALSEAAAHGHESTVTLLLNRGADIHADNQRALVNAAAFGHVSILSRLLDECSTLRVGGEAALKQAAHRGHLDVVSVLYERGVREPAELGLALYTAFDAGQLAVARRLLECGAPVSDDHLERAFREVGERDDPRLVEALLDHRPRLPAQITALLELRVLDTNYDCLAPARESLLLERRLTKTVVCYGMPMP